MVPFRLISLSGRVWDEKEGDWRGLEGRRWEERGWEGWEGNGGDGMRRDGRRWEG